MENLKNYKKYYFLETGYLQEVTANFSKNKFLTAEEFFAIVIWKSSRYVKRMAKKIKDDIKNHKYTIKQITGKVYKETDLGKKIKILDDLPGVGIPMASAILTVCYPKIFTVVDYRAVTSLVRLLEEDKSLDEKKIKERKLLKKHFDGNPTISRRVYLKYRDMCEEESKKLHLSLRNFDRILWAKDFYDGENGLTHLVDGLS